MVDVAADLDHVARIDEQDIVLAERLEFGEADRLDRLVDQPRERPRHRLEVFVHVGIDNRVIGGGRALPVVQNAATPARATS